MRFKKGASLDHFRVVAALLVIAIHTSPLGTVNAEGDFFLTRILARIAVPFFLMLTGQFIAADFIWNPAAKGRRLGRYLLRLSLLYLLSILIYLPFGIYAGYYENITVSTLIRLIVWDGTFYHLWYFPACIIGLLVLYLLRKRFNPKGVWAAVIILYGIGLLGDSYYGLTQGMPALAGVYDRMFHLFSYTRNGLFYAPVFLFLGAAAAQRPICGRPQKQGLLLLWFLVLLTAEAFLLRQLHWQRHDSMYGMLLPVMLLLYRSLLVKNQREDRLSRTAATWIYLLHPIMIILVRGIAKMLHAQVWLIENSLIHYAAVSTASLITAYLLAFISQQRRKGRSIEKSESLD